MFRDVWYMRRKWESAKQLLEREESELELAMLSWLWNAQRKCAAAHSSPDLRRHLLESGRESERGEERASRRRGAEDEEYEVCEKTESHDVEMSMRATMLELVSLRSSTW